MTFNANTAFEYARMISRPRRVGSGEDAAVGREIAGTLAGSGFQVSRQPFRFSTAPNVMISVELLASQGLILLVILLRGMGSGYYLPAAAMLLVLLAVFIPLNRAVQDGSVLAEDGPQPGFWSRIWLRLGSRYRTENIVACLPQHSASETSPHLYLMAHYDSKSQRLPLAARMVLFALTISGTVTFTVLALLDALMPALAPISLWIGGLTIACGIPLLFLDVGNKSPGAIDDASGVGMVLHLAELFAARRNSMNGLKLTVLITSAEEYALMGARAYLQSHVAALRQQAETGGLYVLNFEGPGIEGQLSYAGPGKSSGNHLAGLIEEAGEESGTKIGRFALPGALMDHAPFAEQGFNAASLVTIGKAARAIHTPDDSVDKLHSAGFGTAGLIATKVIEKLAHGQKQP